MKKDFLPKQMTYSPDVSKAIKYHQPLVALESTVITHGLPHPENLKLARDLEKEVKEQGAVPATIGIINGKVHIGLEDEELQFLATTKNVRKVSRRDFGIVLANKENGGTTVAGTLISARLAGVKVFATGGIGGVHRGNAQDISADLPELGRQPMVVVCAGAKAILDLPATLEYLETSGVPVIGYQTDEFPAFYSEKSGLKVNFAAQTPIEIVRIAQSHWNMGLQSAVLVVIPPPAEFAMQPEEMEDYIRIALMEADDKKIKGSAVTPFLLERMSQLSNGVSLNANLALLKNNAALAAKIAREFVTPEGVETI